MGEADPFRQYAKERPCTGPPKPQVEMRSAP